MQRIHTKLVFNIEDGALIHEEGYYILNDAKPMQLKGATDQQTNIAGSQQSFTDTLQKDFGTAFEGQQNILNGLQKSYQQTLAGGPSQFGFNPGETSALNTLATTQNSVALRQAKAAAGQAAAAAGGNAVLPTGAAGGTQAEISQRASENLSNNLLGIQEAGYKTGREQYDKAASGLQNVAQLNDPARLAATANQAGEGAFQSATQIQKANDAANPWNMVGGLVGSLGGAALNTFLPGAGSIFGGPNGGPSLATDGNAPIINQKPVNYGPAPSGPTGNWGNAPAMPGFGG